MFERALTWTEADMPGYGFEVRYTLDVTFRDAAAAESWLDTSIECAPLPNEAFAGDDDEAQVWNEILRVAENDLPGELGARTVRELLSIETGKWSLEVGRLRAKRDDNEGDPDAERLDVFRLVGAFVKAAKGATKGELFLVDYTIDYGADPYASILTITKKGLVKIRDLDGAEAAERFYG